MYSGSSSKCKSINTVLLHVRTGLPCTAEDIAYCVFPHNKDKDSTLFRGAETIELARFIIPNIFHVLRVSGSQFLTGLKKDRSVIVCMLPCKMCDSTYREFKVHIDNPIPKQSIYDYRTMLRSAESLYKLCLL